MTKITLTKSKAYKIHLSKFTMPDGFNMNLPKTDFQVKLKIKQKGIPSSERATPLF